MYDASVMKYGELAHGESLRGRGWGGAVVPSPPPSRAEPPRGFLLGLQRAVPDTTHVSHRRGLDGGDRYPHGGCHQV